MSANVTAQEHVLDPAQQPLLQDRWRPHLHMGWEGDGSSAVFVHPFPEGNDGGVCSSWHVVAAPPSPRPLSRTPCWQPQEHIVPARELKAAAARRGQQQQQQQRRRRPGTGRRGASYSVRHLLLWSYLSSAQQHLDRQVHSRLMIMSRNACSAGCSWLAGSAAAFTVNSGFFSKSNMLVDVI